MVKGVGDAAALSVDKEECIVAARGVEADVVDGGRCWQACCG